MTRGAAVTPPATDSSISGLHAELAGARSCTGSTSRSPGEVHVVMGPNGSGKSTLAHALMGRPGTTVTAGQHHRSDGHGAGRRCRAGSGPGPACSWPCSSRSRCPGSPAAASMAEALGGERRCRRRRRRAGGGGRRPSASTGAFSTGRSTSTCPAASASATRSSSSACSGRSSCVLDEIDSGLDVDALRGGGPPAERATAEWGLGIAGRDPLPPPARVELRPTPSTSWSTGASWPPAVRSWPTSWSRRGTRPTGPAEGVGLRGSRPATPERGADRPVIRIRVS